MSPPYNSSDWRDVISVDDSCRKGVVDKNNAFVPIVQMYQTLCRNIFISSGNIIAADGGSINIQQNLDCKKGDGGAPTLAPGVTTAPLTSGPTTTTGPTVAPLTTAPSSNTNIINPLTPVPLITRAPPQPENAFMTFLKGELIKGLPNEYLLIAGGVILVLILLLLLV